MARGRRVRGLPGPDSHCGRDAEERGAPGECT